MFDNFQKRLRREAEIWRDEGIISASQYQQIADRHQFKSIEAAARDRFMMIAVAIGGVLLVLGMTTFIAANWFAWAREVKFIMMMSLFCSVSIIGFYTWQEPKVAKKEGKKPQRSNRYLGEALLILAAFILGVNIMLTAQIFNISGSTTQLFLAWGFGVSIMAYSLSLNSLGIMAIILVQIGYWSGVNDLWYSSAADWNWARLAVRHMPLISWLLFVPLAYACRSRWIFFFAACFFASSLQINLNPLPLQNFANMAPWVASFALALPPALFWSYDDLLFPNINYRLFQPIARNLALIAFGLVFYALSFRWQWQGVAFNAFPSRNNSFLSLPIIDLGILSGLAVLQWLFIYRQTNNPPRREAIFKTGLIATFLGFIVVVPFWHQAINRIGELGSFIFSVLFVILAWGFVQEGLKLNNRRSFWGGMLLLTLLVISRMLEYDTDLLFKSMVFVMCGSILISAGVWFERRITGGSSSSSGSKSKE
ncbi:MAG TPA: DUF2157 domain-containing protein [Trichormus sp. M33_DOE_039]|nr:DUF2157 domain-containing protein [Trichormus sp. M33_DOE_039]